MFTQFLGNYILSKGLVTADQLIDAISSLKQTHLKLGTLAIHSGYMTSTEVEHIHILQTHIDKKFGELAVEEGYLTPDQLNELISSQKPNYLVLGQAFIDKGYFTTSEFEEILYDYQSEQELAEIDFSNADQEKISNLIYSFYKFPGSEEVTDQMTSYMDLFFNNLIRFIGEDFTPLKATIFPEYPTNFCVTQNILGRTNFFTALDMSKETAIAFGSRYIGEKFEDFDEYISASVEDFLNLHNGLYTVNMSNDHSIELELDPPLESKTKILTRTNMILIPIVFTFGTVNLILSYEE